MHWYKLLMPLYASMVEMPYLDGVIFEYAQYSHLAWKTEQHLKTVSLTDDDAKQQLHALTTFLSGAGALPPEKTLPHAQI